MSTDDSRPPVARPDSPAPDPRNLAPPLRTQWTPARQRIFLAALLESGSVTHAAWAAGMSRTSAHGLRKRLAGTPFDRLWDQTIAEHARRMADPFASPPAPPPRPAAPVQQRPPQSPR
jgi:hypothetical protein